MTTLHEGLFQIIRAGRIDRIEDWEKTDAQVTDEVVELICSRIDMIIWNLKNMGEDYRVAIPEFAMLQRELRGEIKK
ncbi:MAG: hypothetical protein R3321_02355 [Nitrososphaeraceae archaeon]|nr:hypothetical protein [Nitrososphaeraceae archaeon]